MLQEDYTGFTLVHLAFGPPRQKQTPARDWAAVRQLSGLIFSVADTPRPGDFREQLLAHQNRMCDMWIKSLPSFTGRGSF